MSEPRPAGEMPPDPFTFSMDEVPDFRPIHEWYMAMIAGGFRPDEALEFMVALITSVVGKQQQQEKEGK